MAALAPFYPLLANLPPPTSSNGVGSSADLSEIKEKLDSLIDEQKKLGKRLERLEEASIEKVAGIDSINDCVRSMEDASIALTGQLKTVENRIVTIFETTSLTFTKHVTKEGDNNSKNIKEHVTKENNNNSKNLEQVKKETEKNAKAIESVIASTKNIGTINQSINKITANLWKPEKKKDAVYKCSSGHTSKQPGTCVSTNEEASSSLVTTLCCRGK